MDGWTLRLVIPNHEDGGAFPADIIVDEDDYGRDDMECETRRYVPDCETCHLTLKDDHEAYGEAFYIWWECDECGVTIPKTVGMPELRYCPSCGRRIVK